MTDFFDHNDELARQGGYFASGEHIFGSARSVQVDGKGTVGHFIGDSIGYITGKATGYLIDNSRVHACNASEVFVLDNGKLKATGDMTVYAFDNATIYAAFGEVDIFVYGENVKVMTAPTWTGKVIREGGGAFHIERNKAGGVKITRI